VHGRVVELDALPDADRPRAEHEYLPLVADDRLVLVLVGRVEVGDVALELARAGVDHLVDREQSEFSAEFVDVGLPDAPEPRDELVREAHALGLPEVFCVPGMFPKHLLVLDDRADAVDEQEVDPGCARDDAGVGAAPKQLRDREHAVVGADRHVLQKRRVRRLVELRHVHVAHADLERAHRLQQALLDRPADRHDLAGRLHLRRQLVRRGRELVEREARHLRDDVVERRLEARGRVRDLNLVERHADRDLRRNARDRVAARLRGERGRARHARVDLDHVVVERVRVERELHVAAALDLQRADDAKRAVPEQMVLLVRQRLTGRDDDRVAGVYADRVDVLHVADGDRGVVAVAHDLVLDLLVALDALLDEHLLDGREPERVFHQRAELVLAVGEAAAGAAERERRAQHDRIADLFRRLNALVDRVCDQGRQHRLPELLAELLEQLAVLGALDRARRRAEQLDLALAQHALFLELHREVQPRLAADAGHDRVRALEAQDFREVLELQRLHIDLVGDGRVRHDRRGVRVHEDDLVALLLERQARLRSGIVELRRLPDDDGSRADDEYLVDVRALRHGVQPPSWTR